MGLQGRRVGVWRAGRGGFRVQAEAQKRGWLQCRPAQAAGYGESAEAATHLLFRMPVKELTRWNRPPLRRSSAPGCPEANPPSPVAVDTLPLLAVRLCGSCCSQPGE